MKKILAMAAVAALAAGASAYAANPFSDVSTSDWAYQAISDLSDRGMVEGYPDGTFKGQQNITRFEVAQIIARLMAKEDQMNAEDRAIIDRLASEYGAELQNLGVRVSNLEKKVGNIAWSGDARIRFQKASGDNYVKNNQFNGRIRLNARATVNDSTYVHGRLVANGNFDDSDSKGGDVSMDRLYVHHQLGKVGATLGRYELDLGQQVGGWLYANKFDGIELAAPLGEKVNLALGYGRMKDISESTKIYALDEETGVVGKRLYKSDAAKSEVFYAQLKADFKTFKIGFDYFKLSPYTIGYYDNTDAEDPSLLGDGEITQKKSVWGVNVLVPINKFRIFADYYADTQTNKGYSVLYGKDDQKGKIWTIGLGYGAKDLQKAGSFNLDLAYYNVKAGLYEFGMTGAQAPTMDRLLAENGHFWLASGDVVVAKNTYVHGEYAFGAKKDGVYYSKEYADSWTLSLNYKF